jgi:hypothetical protein
MIERKAKRFLLKTLKILESELDQLVDVVIV